MPILIVYVCTQVMPQLLHYLNIDKKAQISSVAESADEKLNVLETTQQRKLYLEATRKTLDWGSIDVYTCTGSCAQQPLTTAYYEEFIFIQPPLALMSNTSESEQQNI
jgi:hypothetical protein